MALVAWSFGPFQLDERSQVLFREGERVPITDRQGRVLLTLASHPGTLLSKDVLVAAGWGDVSVTDNSVEKAISSLRRTLGYRRAVPTDILHFPARVVVTLADARHRRRGVERHQGTADDHPHADDGPAAAAL